MAESFSGTALGVRPGEAMRSRCVTRQHRTIGDEGDEDMSLDAMVEPVVDRPDREAALEFLEGLFDFGELDVIAQHPGRILRAQVAAQEIVTHPRYRMVR